MGHSWRLRLPWSQHPGDSSGSGDSIRDGGGSIRDGGGREVVPVVAVVLVMVAVVTVVAVVLLQP